MREEYVAGVDIGGTNTEFAIVDRRGNIIASDRIPTIGHSDAASYCGILAAAIFSVADKAGVKRNLRGIGIGAPCANYITGEIEAATDLPWPSPIPLKRMVEAATSLPVAVANDANAAAIGEMTYGAARGMKNFIVLTLGTGVGSGIVCDGRLLNGSRGFAGELGHVIVRRNDDRKCGCGRYNCLQTYCSAKGIVLTALKFLKNSETSSLLRELPESEITSAEVAKAATSGDTIAKDVFEFTGAVLGEACANFAAFTDPEAIILFGGVAKAGNLLIEPMIRSMEENMLHLYSGRVRVILSGLNDASAALLGASALGWDAAEGNS